MAHFDGRGFRINYVEQGEGEPVVFLHGILMDHLMFAPQFEDLPHSFRCIAWDMRGHGQSQTPEDSWSLQDIVDDLEAFIDDRDAGPCHLVGADVGGMAALRLAIQKPAKVARLILIDTSAGAEDPESAGLYTAWLEQVAAMEHPSPKLAELVLPLLFSDDYLASNRDAVAVHLARITQMDHDALIETVRAVIGRDDQTSALSSIKAPTLVIHGDADRAINSQAGQVLADSIQGAELFVVPGAGHSTCLEAPDEVNARLSGFLRT